MTFSFHFISVNYSLKKFSSKYYRKISPKKKNMSISSDDVHIVKKILSFLYPNTILANKTIPQ